MSLAALASVSRRRSAAWFGRTASGAQNCAWFPRLPEEQPAVLAEYSIAAGAVAVGQPRARSTDLAAAVMRPESLISISIDAALLPYQPVKTSTTVIFGPALASGSPDPALTGRYRIVEFRTLNGVMEIDMEQIQGMPGQVE